VVFFLASTIPQSAVGQEDYRVLPIKSQLDVSLVFIDVDPTLFGARTVDEILRLVSNNVRKTAKAVLHRSEPYEYAPFEFEVRLSGREFRLVPLEEFRLLLRSLNNPTPRELLEKEGVSGSLSSIHAPSALKMLVDLTRKHAPDILKNHVIFFICGARALGSTPIYHTFGQIPETRKYGGELLINMYGGPWWGRYVFVDLCAPTGYREYRPIQNLNTASERLAMLVNYVDELIDLQFVKSTLYYPRYRLQLFVDIVVVDATKLGLNFNQLVQSFDIETVEQALITLTPYNLYTFKVRLFKANEIPGFTGIIRIDQGKNLALFEAYKAYDLLKRSGKLFEESADYVYVPAIVVVTDYNTRVYLESDPDGDGFLGIALPNPENPRLGEVAVAGASYYSLFYEGLAATVVHEIAHVLGLSHPHDDFDEEAGDEVYGRMIYTDGIETFMSYSTTWVEAIKRRTIRENFYPIKTYWSVFDLDAIDRAVISLLLSSYEENYQQIINRL
ncbi:MAG: hypothetical protein RMH74_01045, partial [Candidatus Caldarchaeum sp.]|nr:hypothetical protein [Candidatus Caldarchaeum sp.]